MEFDNIFIVATCLNILNIESNKTLARFRCGNRVEYLCFDPSGDTSNDKIVELRAIKFYLRTQETGLNEDTFNVVVKTYLTRDDHGTIFEEMVAHVFNLILKNRLHCREFPCLNRESRSVQNFIKVLELVKIVVIRCDV